MTSMRKFVYQIEVVVDEDPHESRRDMLNTILALEFEHLITGRSFAIPGKVMGDTGNVHFIVQSVVVNNYQALAQAATPALALVPLNGNHHAVSAIH